MGKETKRRLLFIMQLPPPVHGASLRNEFVAKSKLINQQFNVNILPLNFAVELKDLERLSIRKIFAIFPFFFRLIKFLILQKPDFVYYTLSPLSVALFRDCIFIAIIRLFRIPIIHHLRVIGVSKASMLKKHFTKFALKKGFVISLSQTAAKDIQPYFKGKPFIVNNGLEDPISQFNLKLRTEERNKSIKKILFLSNLYESKGVIILIKAIKILSKKRNDFVLTIAGPTTKEISTDRLKQLIRSANIENTVKTLPGIFGKDKYVEYLKSDIFVFPTFYPIENFPGVILEAMACGLPIVTTKVASIPEIIEDKINGILIDKENPIQLADAIELLMNDETLSGNLGKAARLKFIQNYENRVYERNMYNCFYEIITSTK